MQKEDKIKKIIENQIKKITPSSEEMHLLNTVKEDFFAFLRDSSKKHHIEAEIFLGGSLAKGTLIKKDKYDVDVFVRFSRRHENISHLLEKVLGATAKKIHGSRDYYQIKKHNILIEVIPVLKISNPEEAENVTDLSYFHVRYLLEQARKNKKLPDEIRIAKNFCYAQKCYGAESYIKGFSGYALELLMCHYGSFLSFIQALAALPRGKRIILDDMHHYKNTDHLLQELNESKRQSPIILIDPTFKDRNALAGLSYETFERFQKSCRAFLKNPSLKFFEEEKVGEKFKDRKIIQLHIKTNKQAGDIAGTKSKKFYNFFMTQLNRDFKLKLAEFEYDEIINKALFYFSLDKKKDEIIRGPHITHVDNVTKFKKVHPNAFIKGHYTFVKLKHTKKFEEWLKDFKKKFKSVFQQMGIIELKIIEIEK